MELGQSIRMKIGSSLLKKKLQKKNRKVFYSDIDQVKKIGIVWDATQVNEFNCLSKFYQKMHDRNIDVNIIGYFPGKILPDQYTAIRYLTCIRREELNFFYHPISSESDTFINKKFDILIDINFTNLLTLKYLSSLSNAAFKVGLFDNEKSETPFDLMMELSNPPNVENYLEQTLHYLEMIHTGNVKPIN